MRKTKKRIGGKGDEGRHGKELTGKEKEEDIEKNWRERSWRKKKKRIGEKGEGGSY